MRHAKEGKFMSEQKEMKKKKRVTGREEISMKVHEPRASGVRIKILTEIAPAS